MFISVDVCTCMQAVLAAVSHNLHAADLLLRDMEQHQAPSGTDSDEDLPHAHSLNLRHMQPLATAVATASGQSHKGRTAKAPAPPEADSAASSGGKQTEEEEAGSADVYFKYRREALKLSRTWRKKLHRAANAFAAGDHSGQFLHVQHTTT